MTSTTVTGTDAMKKFIFEARHVSGLSEFDGVLLPEGLPIVFNDAFEPIEPFNSWLRSLRKRGCKSPKTWRGYADDLLAWGEFLDSRRQELLGPTEELENALADYRHLRLKGTPGDVSKLLGPSAWNRAVAALDNFYSWALDEKRIEAKPFRYRQTRVTSGNQAGRQIRKNLATARTGSAFATTRFLEPDFADMFVNVGLGGSKPEGGADGKFRGRLGTRNRALGMLVRSSGLRRQEFSNLLTWEVPTSPGPFSDHVAFPVPHSIAKGGRPRTTWSTPEALDAVASYVQLERSIAVDGSAWMPTTPLFVESADSQGGTVNGHRVLWANLSIDQRRQLVAPSGGSALLFTQAGGAPVKEENWRYVFNEAVERCRAFSARFPAVTPHMLRHTFAMETLNTLTLNAMSRADRLARVSGADPTLMAILRRNDPLLILRDLLGHQFLSSTMIYLAFQDPATFVTDAELVLMAEDEKVKSWALSS
ncbi:tyrosine-type recombinase/integrase [Mycetocola zhadangensis]|uniref:tyrosine-type recombinase/integrase n=1 Tax=Mycetocola zhadangensis TaxID=1164595 RepID=UPI003A4DFE1C